MRRRLPVCTGYLIWHVWLKHKPGGEKIAAVLAKRLNVFVMLTVISPLLVIIFWQAPWEPGHTLLLAAMGLGGLLLGGASTFAIARLNRLESNVLGRVAARQPFRLGRQVARRVVSLHLSLF